MVLEKSFLEASLQNAKVLPPSLRERQIQPPMILTSLKILTPILKILPSLKILTSQLILSPIQRWKQLYSSTLKKLQENGTLFPQTGFSILRILESRGSLPLPW